MNTLNRKTALEQLSDLLRLMLLNIEDDEPSPEHISHTGALKKAIGITSGTISKIGGKSPLLPEMMQLEKILAHELEHYPVPGLRDKLLDNIRKYKTAF